MGRINMNNNENRDQLSVVDRFIGFLLCIYGLLSIFEPYLNGVVGSITKYYIIFIIVFVGFAKRSLAIKRELFPLIVWLLYKFLSLLWSQNYSTPRMHWLSQIGMVAFIVVLCSVDIKKRTFDKFILFSWIASATTGLLSLFFSRSYYSVARQVLVLFGVEIDPNNMAALLLIGISISLYNVFFEKKYVLLSLIIITINSFALFGTASRGGLVSLLALYLVCILFVNKQGKPQWFRNVLVGVFLLIIIYYVSIRYLSEDSFVRVFTFDTYQDGSDRLFLWENAWNLYTQNLITVLFGVGWGTSTGYIGVGVHNTYLSMLCDVGLVGTAIFMVPLFKKIISFQKTNHALPVLFALSCMFPSFFLDAINKRFFWNAVLVVYIYGKLIGESEERDDILGV